MSDTVIKESFRARRVGGGLLVFIALPLSLILLRFGLGQVDSLGDLLIVGAGPALLLAGLWAAFPSRVPEVRLTLSDQAITVHRPRDVIPLDDLLKVKHDRPALSKHDRLTFSTGSGDVSFDIIHLTHEAHDVINLIGLRLEKRGAYLSETRSDVLGAATGIWEVRQGTAFET